MGNKIGKHVAKTEKKRAPVRDYKVKKKNKLGLVDLKKILLIRKEINEKLPQRNVL